MTGTHTLPIAPRLIVQNETEFWEMDKCPHPDHVERIESVYLYDENVLTYLCSFQGAHFYQPVYTRAVFVSGAWDMEDSLYEKMKEEVDEWVMKGDADNAAGYSLYGETVAKKALPDVEWEKEDQTYEEALEAVLEDCRANWQI